MDPRKRERPALGQRGESQSDGAVQDQGNTPRLDLTRTSWSAADLLAAEFPEPRWAVPEVIPEGVTLLAGPPKLGKSWLVLGVSMAVASGGMALSSVKVEQGDVLHLSLEDPPRRLQRRLRAMLGDDPGPEELTLWTACPRLADGGAERIGVWLDQHEAARLVVVDVLERMRGPAPVGNAYSFDYDSVAQLKAVADAHRVAMVIVHHVRKADAADYLDTVSGTNGLAGASDSVMVLKRTRGKADGVLCLTGRDVEEAEHALRFDASRGLWVLTDPADALTETRARIVAYLRTVKAASPAEIAKALGIERNTAGKVCRRMHGDGLLDTDGDGRYFLSSVSPQGKTAGQPEDTTGDRVSPLSSLLRPGTPGTPRTAVTAVTAVTGE
jgi:hypothetical protein